MLEFNNKKGQRNAPKIIIKVIKSHALFLELSFNFFMLKIALDMVINEFKVNTINIKIFMLDSQCICFEMKICIDNKETQPAFKLEKNACIFNNLRNLRAFHSLVIIDLHFEGGDKGCVFTSL